MLRRFFSSPRAVARGQSGWRAYGVGDVHGRLDLLDDLLDRIEADHRARPPAKALVVLIGDVIDRGPDTAGVIERLRSFDRADVRLVCLAGNHEEVLLRILAGETRALGDWLRFGGAEALASYGVNAANLESLDPQEARRRILAAIPETHRNFLEGLADSFRFGDYLFVHAGIRPGVPLDQQRLADLRWIREPFLTDPRDHGVVVVHGHTISEAVEEFGSRIGIDTGAYATGRLLALGIEDDRRWILDTVGQPAVQEADLVR